MKHILFRLVPSKLKPRVRKLYQYLEYETGKRIGGRDVLLPPKWLHSVSSPDLNASLDYKIYQQTGEEFFRYFVNIGGVQPNQRVLDVGCGTGRMALPLTKYLKDGSYVGIDIVASSVKWCQKTYTPRHPNFRFHFSDIQNTVYNPAGECRASEYSFPFESSSFDFVFLTSVFTHMLPQDRDNYLSEVVRVLKRDGRCLITYFLLNKESLGLIDAKISLETFKYDLPGCRVRNPDVPEAVVAYDESSIRSSYKTHGLDLSEPIYFGKWCGRKNGLSWQDMIVATKPH
jgi:ubiquinone/menaquinone biosynthesis C-methylase UbiE